MAYLSIVFLLAAVIFFVLSYQQRRKAGIPTGRVIYSDTRKWGKVEKPIFDPNLRLTGKPDYLVEQGDQIIPVEVKSGKTPQAPFDSHIYQLAAYCLLVEYAFGKKPDAGIIHYPNRTFAIDFTSSLEQNTKAIIQEMQEKTARSRVDRSHDEPRRCQKCGYRSVCDQSLRI